MKGDRAVVEDEVREDLETIVAALRIALQRGASFEQALRELEADRIAEETFLP